MSMQLDVTARTQRYDKQIWRSGLAKTTDITSLIPKNSPPLFQQPIEKQAQKALLV